MQKTNTQQLFDVHVVLESGKIKHVRCKASTQEVAENRALKRTLSGVRIHHCDKATV